MRIPYHTNTGIVEAAKKIAIDVSHLERIMISPSSSETLKIRDILLEYDKNIRLDKIYWNGRTLQEKVNNAEFFEKFNITPKGMSLNNELKGYAIELFSVIAIVAIATFSLSGLLALCWGISK